MRANGKVCRIYAVIDGTKYEPGPISAKEADRLTAWTGYSLREWEGEVANGDPLACRALICLTEFRKGNHVRFDDIDIEDVDSIEADLKDDRGRRLSQKIENGQVVMRGNQPVWLFDGEEDEPDPPLAASPTD